MLQGTGLGKAHSGGALLDLALASCKRLDVFGAGMFSLGPGEDVVYQHFLRHAVDAALPCPVPICDASR